MPAPDLQELAARLHDFAQARGWEHYHDPKNLSMSVAIEAGELLEQFQWITSDEAVQLKDDRAKVEQVADEMADTLIYLIRLADVLEVDLAEAARRKIERNEARFPVLPEPGGASRGIDG